VVYLHVNTEVWFWCSSGILVFPEPNTPKLAAAERISSVMFIYIGIVVVLMYFIEKGRINAIEWETQPSDWPELSENWCVRPTQGGRSATDSNCRPRVTVRLSSLAP
jgi:hypothetical protein